MSMPHQVGLNLVPTSAKQLVHLGQTQDQVYINQNGVYQPIFTARHPIKQADLDGFLKKGIRQFFVTEEDFARVKVMMYQMLQESTRRLSVGDALKSGTDHLSILLQNLSILYEDYHNQNLLSLIFQTAPSFTIYLQANKKIIPELYLAVCKEQTHYLFKQPVLSSLFLAAFLIQYNIFSTREVQDLFLISLVKDLGMCFLPREAWDKKDLDSFQQDALNQHAQNSVQLLRDRIPIHHSGLYIVEHHHFHNDTVRKFLKEQKIEQDTNLIHGIETTITAMSDLICAMYSPRPYRKAYNIDIVKKVTHLVLKDLYPEEDRLLIKFIDHFFDLS